MKTPDRANLHAVCDMVREMFDGDPSRVTDILNDRLGPFNPATDFVVALLTVTVNALKPYPPTMRQRLVADIRTVADALPADGTVTGADR